MRDNVTEASLKMFGRTHRVTTAVYHLETADNGIHYPELLQQECEMRCITPKFQALATKV